MDLSLQKLHPPPPPLSRRCGSLLPRPRFFFGSAMSSNTWISSYIAAIPDYSRRRLQRAPISKIRYPAQKGFASWPQGGSNAQKKEKKELDERKEPETTAKEHTSAGNEFTNMMKEKMELDERHEPETTAKEHTSSNEFIDTTEDQEQDHDLEEVHQRAILENSAVEFENYLEAVQSKIKDERDIIVVTTELIGPLGKEAVRKGEINDADDSMAMLMRLNDAEPIPSVLLNSFASPTSDTSDDTIEHTNSNIGQPGTIASRERESVQTEGTINSFVSPTSSTSDDTNEHTNLNIDQPGTIASRESESVQTEGTINIEKQDYIKNILLSVENAISLPQSREKTKAQDQKQMLENLAERNLSSGCKVFMFPQIVKPDNSIEIFFNRSLSTLATEPNIFVKGAFNEWKWRPFTAKLLKTDLQGDWWSCHLHVPREAYKIDFVFYNGENMYDNNSSLDFFIIVEGGMKVSEFDDFLLEEKKRELGRLAAEEAERQKLAVEQQQREAEHAASESARNQAKAEVLKKRDSLQKVKKLAVTSFDNVWFIDHAIFKGEDKVRLYYNRSSRPLVNATEIWIHGGHNNWIEGLSLIKRLECSVKKGGDWWYADVVLPDRALILDWVFADAPPQMAKVYDNNNYIDFHAIVPKCIPEELFWDEEEHRIYRNLQEERKIKEAAAREKAERKKHMKCESKGKSFKKLLLSQRRVVYTEPLEVCAGTNIMVFYNPSNTVLSGKSGVWFKCGFNRWTHHYGPLPPQKMVPSENVEYFMTTVQIPIDAYFMDFVFSESEDGELYDNRNGLDYHIPVSGGLLKAPPLHIVHIAVEMAPIAKVGGLGDVVTGLSRAVQDLGHTVDIILPKYDCININNVEDFSYNRSFSWGGTVIKVWYGKVEGLQVYFLEPQNGKFWSGCIYGGNDADRFGFFCHAALEYLFQIEAHPDILHCHDWSSAPVAWLFKEHYNHGLSNARVIFTIHNLEFGAYFIGKAMANTDKATTVSHTYSKEVSGNPVIAPHLHKFHGILNGIDADIWDPYNDNFIPVSYTSENVIEGKNVSKKALQQRLGLREADHPLVGIITRLTVQKGIHLIKHAIRRILDLNGQVVLLGSAPDPRIQSDFINLANELHSSHSDSVRLCLTYDEPLSHLIYAGADFVLVPSIFEPCGLTQLIAMRYGAIPVARKTGGLYDTVFDVDNDVERAQSRGFEPNGFTFDAADSAGVDYALNRAITAWYDKREWFHSLNKQVMGQDWSWNQPALDYIELYYAAQK